MGDVTVSILKQCTKTNDCSVSVAPAQVPHTWVETVRNPSLRESGAETGSSFSPPHRLLGLLSHALFICYHIHRRF